MRTLFLAFLLLPLLAPSQPASPQAPQDQASKPAPPEVADAASLELFRQNAEEGIKHTLVSQVEAWNHGNLQAYMNGYWHSPELTFYSGATVTQGWEPTLERYRQRYQNGGREMGQLEFQDLKIDLLGRRAAVVTGKWQLTMSDGKKPRGLFTLILKQMTGGWRIVHDHSSGE
ncbi:MAG TPA: DUF4440 domain-containing protein [Alphaproteobacteria bacterium]|nr:DUF4440 domain-containing protein [Alphaproteobacteria bacterium]